MEEGSQSILAKLFDKTAFETFIQECLQAKLQTYPTNNPLYSLITKTHYALTQSTPLHAENKIILEKLTQSIDKPMKVAVIGQFSSGKSTFLNALLGKEILSSGITPVTAKVCEITYGDEMTLEIFYKNGKSMNKPISYLNETDEMEVTKIAYYKLYVPLPLLKEISFLDTPGFNSQNESDTDTTNAILEEVDGIIWLTLADNVGKNSEKEILQMHIKRYASKSLCVLNQKDRLKNQNEIDTSLNYAKKAFEGFFEDIIAISAKQALEAITMQLHKQGIDKHDESFLQHGLLMQYHNNTKDTQNTSQDSTLAGYENSDKSYDKKIAALFLESNIQAVIDFIYKVIRPQALQAKEYRILRQLRTLIVQEKRKIHRVNRAHKRLDTMLQIYVEKVRFNALQSGLEKTFQKLFVALESQFDNLTQKIYNSFEMQPITIIRETKRLFGLKRQHKQIKEVNILPKDKLLSALHNDDNEFIRDFKRFGFSLSEFGNDFETFIRNQIKELANDLEEWREQSLQSLNFAYSQDMALSDGIIDRHFRTEVIMNAIFYDYEKKMIECVCFLQSELSFLQKSLANNFQNAVALCLERLSFEVQNAITKHKNDPDTLPLYNPTLENVRNLINLGLHFTIYQENLSLNFPLYKKALWNLTQNLTKMYDIKHGVIEEWIVTNQQKYKILESCEDSIKQYR